MLLKQSSPLVSICIPFSRNPLPKWAISFKSIIDPMNATSQLLIRENWPRDEARNSLCEEALITGSKYMLFLDDDVTVRPDIVRKLVYEFSVADDDVMVIGGIYCTKDSSGIPLVFKHVGEGAFYKWKLGEVFDCDVLATGMMMIKTELFSHLTKPYFKDVDGVEEGFKYGLLPDNFQGIDFKMTDDAFFCHKVREAGYRILAHGGVLGMHWDSKGTAYLLPDDVYPIQAEMHKRWKSFNSPTEDEYRDLYMTIVKEYYGNVDLLPVREVA